MIYIQQMIKINIDMIGVDIWTEILEISTTKIATGITTGMKEISQEEKSIMVTIILIHDIIHTQYIHHNQKATDIHT